LAALPAIFVGLTLATTSTLVSAAEQSDAEGTLEVARFSDVAYRTDGDGPLLPLTVFAPTAPGPWPTAVMIHGGGGAYGAIVLEPWAEAVAAEGAVVFVPRWANGGLQPDAAEAIAAFADSAAQLACTVRFARSEAGRYGGNPADLSLFGHSGGGHWASIIALTDPAASPGCLAKADSAVPDDLVLFEGDWLLHGHPTWDVLLAQDHAVWAAQTPWPHLVDGPRLPVTILDSDDRTLAIEPRARIDESMGLRDPGGSLAEKLERSGALADGRLTETEAQQLLADELAALGYPVSFVDLPDSNHEFLSGAALTMLSDALGAGPTASSAT
jgi:acetyl esterase/lipase